MAASATAITAEEPSRKIVLAPSSKWNVEFAESTCILQRAFGTGEEEVGLRLERFEPGDTFQLVLLGKRLKSVAAATGMAIRYGAGSWIDASKSVMILETPDGSRGIAISSKVAGKIDEVNPRPVTPEEERAVTEIGFAPIDRRELVLQTGPLDKAFAAMRLCTDDLMRHLGLDPAVQARLSRKAAPANNAGTWITTQDYPSKPLSRGQQAFLSFRLIVDEKGKAKSCEILRLFGDSDFGNTACEALMRRAKFRPALDEFGKPVASSYQNRIRWSLPN